jgi:hypothetical protein
MVVSLVRQLPPFVAALIAGKDFNTASILSNHTNKQL